MMHSTRITERIRFLQQKYGYTFKTAREYAYRIERHIRLLTSGNLLLPVRSNKWHKKERVLVTLQRHEELQNQSVRKMTIEVIRVETGEKIKIHIKDLLEEENRKRRSEK